MNEASKLRPPWWSTALCFVVPLAMYVSTAARTVQGGDTGEFGLIGIVGGVPHPPGYPLYTLLARLFGLLPVDPPFFRVALSSAFCGAAAVAVIQRLTWRLTHNLWISLATALSLAVTPLLWKLSGVPEVFSMHALTTALSLLWAVRVFDAPAESKARELLGFGLVLGIGMANHHTTVLLAPLVLAVLVLVFRERSIRFLRSLGLFVFGGVLGLVPYLLLPHWSAGDGTRSWIWGEAHTPSGFVTHFLRQEYGTFRLDARHSVTTEVKAHYVLESLFQLAGQYAFLLFVFGLIGILAALRTRRLLALGLTGALLLSALVFPAQMNLPRTAINREVTERFFLMSLVLLAPFVAWGMRELMRHLRPAVILVASMGTICLNASLSYAQANWKSDTTIERYLVAAVTSLPKDAIVLGRTDTLGPGMAWVSRVMKVRPDVRFIDTNMISLRWYHDRIAAEIPGFPMPYFRAHIPVAATASAAAKVAPTFLFPWVVDDAREAVPVQPAGFLYRVATDGQTEIPLAMHRRLIDQDLDSFGEIEDGPFDAWNGRIRMAMAFALNDLRLAYERAGQAEQAEAIMKEITTALPPESPHDIDHPVETGGDLATP